MVSDICKRIYHKYHSWFGVTPLLESQKDIETWFNSPLGQWIQTIEQQLLDQIMPKVYGYHLMQLSVLNGVCLSQQSPVTHHFSLGVSEQGNAKAIASFEQLPIEAESIDGAILHHVLEYSTNPHQLLRETARTIIPNGYIVIVGFNPFSLLGIRKKVGQLLTRTSHWRCHSLRSNRLMDWLQVLDFEPVSVRYGYHGLPFNHGYRSSMDQVCGKILPISGAFYIITARKSVIPMTLIKAPWKKQKVFVIGQKAQLYREIPIIERGQKTNEKS